MTAGPEGAMILRQPGVGVKECQVWQPIEQVFLMDAAGSVSPDDGAKNTSVVYASANGDNVKVTVNGAGGMGKPVHTEWTGKFDGKAIPLFDDDTIWVQGSVTMAAWGQRA